MKKKKITKLNILYLLLFIVYFGAALTAIILAYYSENTFLKKAEMIGGLVLISSIPHIFIFFIRGGFKNSRVIPYFAFAIIGIGFGTCTMFITDIRIDTICAFWGALDICRSIYELFDVVPRLKNREWLKATEIIVAFVEIIIGVLLIINRFDGILTHVKFMGFSFIVLLINEIIILRVSRHHEKGFDNN